MYRVVFSIMTVLVLSCALAAQTSQPSSSGSQTTNPDQTQTTPTTPSTQSTMPGQTPSTATGQSQTTDTITGCLSGPNREGAYMLKSSTGREVEVGGSSDLSANVGKQVTLTGQWAKSGAQIGEREESKDTAERNDRGTTAATGETGRHAERHFQVSSVQKVSDTCEASDSSRPR